MPLSSLIARTYLRYVVPVTVLSALAFAPIAYLALRVPVPGDLAAVKGVVRTTWLLAGLSLGPLFILVGGVAPAVRAIAAGAPTGQLAMVRAGAVSLVSAALPVAIAILAILVGSLALLLPGLALFVLLSLGGATGAPDRDVAGRLAASATLVRANVVPVVIVLVTTLGVAIGTLALVQRGLPMPLPKAPPPELLAAFRRFARLAVGGLALVAPLPAIALAAIAITRAPSART